MSEAMKHQKTTRRVMDKIENHRFRHKAGFTNTHHLKAKTSGGSSIASNLIKLDAYRHCAIHYLFSNKTIHEIIMTIEFEIPLRNLEYSRNAWKLLFGNKNKYEIVALLKRVQKIKKGLCHDSVRTFF
jgi:hypothetical protein